jgi:hypothetical protein
VTTQNRFDPFGFATFGPLDTICPLRFS